MSVERYKRIIIDAQTFLILIEEKEQVETAARILSKSVISSTTLTEIIYLLITQKGLKESESKTLVNNLVKDVRPLDREDSIRCGILNSSGGELSLGDRSSCIVLHERIGSPIYSGDKGFEGYGGVDVLPIENLIL